MPTDLSFLVQVAKPTRYTGGEVNEILKEDRPGLLHVALAFPDGYEIAMSTTGLKILYQVLNEREDVWAERVFMPMPDMEEELLRRSLPLYGLESKRPLSEFDVVGFTLQFELTFTNILHMLRLGRIPRRASERGPSDPVVLAGGPCACNPEPLAPFVDAFLIGDGEEAFPELCEVVRAHKGAPREELWRALARVEGAYVPALYRTEADPATGMEVVAGPGADGAPFPVRRRVLPDIDSHAFPSRILVPHHEVVHDRYSVEIARGCNVGCRFCQAGFTYRPERERPPERIRAAVAGGLRATGFNEVTLLSLNAGEYEGIENLVRGVSGDGAGQSVGVSLPSLRVKTLTRELAESLSAGRKSGFTMAPEAGTQRLRDVINKQVTEEELANAAAAVFSSGWGLVKLYFMIGLPTETEEDVAGIERLSRLVVQRGREAGCKSPKVTVSTSSFVPKPFTPFQWCAMDRPEALKAKQERLKRGLKSPVTYKWHDVSASLVEGAFSLGDRRLARVLETAADLGCRLDAWTEHFRWDLWQKAFETHGVEMGEYLFRERGRDERLPWDVVDVGVSRRFLWQEWENALRSVVTDPCTPENCYACGFVAKCCKSAGPAREREEQAPASPRSERKESVYRYRLRYRKEGLARFLGHLDLVDVLVRALRRAGVRLAYTQGYHPMPKVELPSPLPLGVEGRAEWVEFTAAHVDARGLLASLAKGLPAGLSAEDLFLIPATAPPLSSLTLQVYEIGISGFLREEQLHFRECVERFRAAPEWTVTKEGKGKTRSLDLKKRVLAVEWKGDALEVRLIQGGFMDLVESLCPPGTREKVRLVRLGLDFGPESEAPPNDSQGQ